MTKKLFLALILITQISVLPSWGKDTVLIDQITQSEAQELDIQIPPETPSGYHQIEIEVYDDAGTISAKTILFCKDLLGVIKWDNNCPDLVEAAEGFMQPYDPLDNPEDTQSTQVAAFALLGALAAGKAASNNKNSGSNSGSNSGENSDAADDNSRDDYEESEDSEDLASVGAGGLALIKRSTSWGDRSRTWKSKGTQSVDRSWRNGAQSISAFSPLAARTIGDGSYLRAMFGSLSLLAYPIAIVLGVWSLIDVDRQALPPATWLVIAIALLGTLDAMAGFSAAAIYAIGITVSGNIFTREEALTVAGVMIIFFAPALLASAIRPVRRLISSGDDRWERITDYALVGLLSYFTLSKVVGALNGLSGLKLPISADAKQIALIVAIAITARIILEDLATYLYPVRLETVSPDYKEPTTFQQVISLEFKTFVFVTLAIPFVGFNIQLLIGTFFFLLPSILGLTVGDKYPKVPGLGRVLPKGALKIIVMIFVGSIFANWAESLFENPEDFIPWSFALLAIPGLVLKFAGDFAEKPGYDWRKTDFGRVVYRIGGIAIYILIVQMVRGVDLTAWL
jgi:hypothetical protein